MSKYIATISVPGYLPMDDEPAVFDTAQEAWLHLQGEREMAEDCIDIDMAEADYSQTVFDLARRASVVAKGLICDFEAVGTVHGPTPGYRGDHDLGLAYSVQEVEA